MPEFEGCFGGFVWGLVIFGALLVACFVLYCVNSAREERRAEEKRKRETEENIDRAAKAIAAELRKNERAKD